MSVNEDGVSRLTVLDTQRKLDLAPPGLPQGRLTNLRFDAGGHRLGLSAESAQAPRDAYVYDLETAKLERWTRSETGPAASGERGGAGAHPLPDLGSQRRTSAHAHRLRVPAAQRAVPGGHLHSWRS